MFTPTRVVIVAADSLARSALAALLQPHETLTVVGLAADSDDMGQTCSVYLPDVLLWDFGWDGAERLEALSALTEDLPPILAIAAGDSDGALWAAGVRGVVGRDISAEVLAAGLRAVAMGLAVFDPASIEPRLNPPTVQDAGQVGAVDHLTPRELDVLRAIAEGLPNKLIARELEISEHTVKYHVNSILAKLGAQSRTDAVVRATRSGILLL